MSTDSFSIGRPTSRGRPSSSGHRGRPPMVGGRGRQSTESVSHEPQIGPRSLRSSSISSNRSIYDQADRSILHCGSHSNKKPSYNSYWMNLLLEALDHSVSPKALQQIIISLQNFIVPFIDDLAIPSVSYLKSLKMAVGPLNELHATLFVEKFPEFTLNYDETPYR